jgi:hypothetical protein
VKSKKSIDSFVLELISSKEYPGPVHKCPQCGGRLYLWLGVIEPDDKLGRRVSGKWVTAHAWCDDCQAAVAVDGIVSPPSWLEEAIKNNPSP